MKLILLCLVCLTGIVLSKTVRDVSEMNPFEKRIMNAAHIATSHMKHPPNELMKAAEMIEANLTSKLSKEAMALANSQAERITGRPVRFR